MSEIEILTALEKNLNAVTQTVTVVAETVSALKEMISRRETSIAIVPNISDELLTIKEASEELKVSQSSIRRLMALDPNKEGLESFKVGRNIRISRRAISDYLNRISIN